MSKFQRVAGTALTSVALVSLAACGGGSSSKSAASSGKAAATSGAAAKSSTSAASSDAKTISGMELAQKQKAATGSDYAADYFVTTNLGGLSMSGSGVTSTKGGKTDVKMSLTANGKSFSEVAVGGVMYMHVNGQWYKMDSTTGTQGAYFKLVAQNSAGQITDMAKNQQWTIVSSDSNGTTYETTVTPGAINSAASSMSVKASTSAAEKITEVTDSKGRPTKATVEMPGSGSMEYTISNDRAPITITAPANAKSLSDMGH